MFVKLGVIECHLWVWYGCVCYMYVEKQFKTK